MSSVFSAGMVWIVVASKPRFDVTSSGGSKL
jgi:hypothetical protein